jgi:hypothetical protein
MNAVSPAIKRPAIISLLAVLQFICSSARANGSVQQDMRVSKG